MAQKLVQTQEQKLAQQQRLTQQQMLQVKLLEMPLMEFEQNVLTEIDDNPALEASPEEPELGEMMSSEPSESSTELGQMEIPDDDILPQATYSYGGNNADYEEITYGDPVSFYDRLKEQMGEMELSDEERYVMEYLIGSLDSDGLLRKDLDSICDELAVYHNRYISESELEKVLHRLQQFDPPGIGARTLQECLLLQIMRKSPSVLRNRMQQVIARHFDEFMGKRWDRIAQQMELSDDEMRQVEEELVRLNPKPGSSLGETEGRNIQQITPDFIVDTADDGTVSFTINKGRVPKLYVSESFNELIASFQKNKNTLNRQQKEALVYASEKVGRARSYIEAVKQRRHTLYITMKAIIDWQKKYFQEGDENDLRPMVLKDIADKTGLDISTVSRVCNVKYAQTRWGIFRLRHFFSEGMKNQEGDAVSTRRLKAALQEIIASEDRHHPWNDDALVGEMKKQGFIIARRTIAKYREQLGIPTARLRKR